LNNRWGSSDPTQTKQANKKQNKPPKLQ